MQSDTASVASGLTASAYLNISLPLLEFILTRKKLGPSWTFPGQKPGNISEASLGFDNIITDMPRIFSILQPAYISCCGLKHLSPRYVIKNQPFIKLIMALINRAVLLHFKEGASRDVYTDASGFGLGAVLVVCIGGRTCNCLHESHFLQGQTELFHYPEKVPCSRLDHFKVSPLHIRLFFHCR